MACNVPLASSRWRFFALVALTYCGLATAQSLTATNVTFLDEAPFVLVEADGSDFTRLASLVNLRDSSTMATSTLPLGIFLQRIDPADPGKPDPSYMSLISCDASDYPDDVDPLDVVEAFVDANVSAIILYSRTADFCNYTTATNDGSEAADGSETDTDTSSSSPPYDFIYTTTNAEEARAVDNLARELGGGIMSTSIMSASAMDDFQDLADDAEFEPSGRSSTRTTAVAMIVLYSITAVITALFIAIIVTGVVRAHRHPERYGPRNGAGQPRRSRAKGIARAVLDTLPIVKFGEREGADKPADVEMSDQRRGQLDDDSSNNNNDNNNNHEDGVVGVSGSGQRQSSDGRGDDVDSARPVSGLRREDAGTVRGVGSGSEDVGRGTDGPANEGQTQETQSRGADVSLSCSICTEDFHRGEDIRVLPCDHKFHPACVDPWLLNVSGTCPLCRIDLRPTSQTSADFNENPDNDSNDPANRHSHPLFPTVFSNPYSNPTGLPTPPNGDLSPPLDDNAYGSSSGAGSSAANRRLSGLRNVLNRRRLQNAPAAERIAALQQMREERRRSARRGSAFNNDNINDNINDNVNDGIANNNDNAERDNGYDYSHASNDHRPNSFIDGGGRGNGLLAPDESTRRGAGRISMRLQEAFGVRTRRPESAVLDVPAGGATTITAATAAAADNSTINDSNDHGSDAQSAERGGMRIEGQGQGRTVRAVATPASIDGTNHDGISTTQQQQQQQDPSSSPSSVDRTNSGGRISTATAQPAVPQLPPLDFD